MCGGLFDWVVGVFYNLGINQNETAMLIRSVIVVVHNFRHTFFTYLHIIKPCRFYFPVGKSL